jgi:hypothetical protein
MNKGGTMEKEIKPMLLTTSDNPFNPFTQQEDWEAFDRDHGYNCSAYLARVAFTSPDLPQDEYTKAVNDAVLSIIEFSTRYPDPTLPDGVTYEIAFEE